MTASVEVAHPLADRRRGGDDIGNHLAHPLFGESVYWTRNTKRRNDAAGVITNRGGDGVESVLQFLDRDRVSVSGGRLDLRLELPLRRDRVRGESGKSRGGQHFSALFGCHVRQQHLAAGG